jgi:acyl carrier protein
MNQELFNKVKEFAVNQAAVEEKEATESASIEDDLGISGEDAVEFIIAFGKKFNVDVSKFMAAEYFSPEGDVILPAIIRFFTGKKQPKRKNLTIGHLIKAIVAGRLDEEVINS